MVLPIAVIDVLYEPTNLDIVDNATLLTVCLCNCWQLFQLWPSSTGRREKKEEKLRLCLRHRTRKTRTRENLEHLHGGYKARQKKKKLIESEQGPEEEESKTDDQDDDDQDEDDKDDEVAHETHPNLIDYSGLTIFHLNLLPCLRHGPHFSTSGTSTANPSSDVAGTGKPTLSSDG
jgi:hypothetical protein